MKYEKLLCTYLCTFLMFAVGTFTMAQSECTSGFLPVDNIQITDNGFQYMYLPPETTSSNGTQVIVPQMKFTCHGVITGWSALTVAINPAIFNNVRHQIAFQVWRPKSDESDDGGYTLVGSNVLAFAGLVIEDGPTPMDLDNDTTAYFRFEHSVTEDRISFQPGDVVGWYTVAAFTTISPPLSVVFRSATNADDPSLIVDMYSSLVLHTPCELSTCDEAVNHHFSVIPYVSVQYSMHTPASSPTLTPSPACVPTSITSCTPPTRTAVSSQPTTTTTTTTEPPTMIVTESNTIMLLLIIGVAVAAAVLVIFIVMIGMFLLCCAFKRKNGDDHQTRKCNENPTYAAPDTPPTLVTTELGVHYQASNGSLYALPHGHRSQSLDSKVALLETDNLFDGDCYASTYHTNGQMHVYQELEKRLPDHRGGSVPSRRPLHSARGSIPRFSTTSINNFPYTMPSTPAPSYPNFEASGSRPRPPTIPLPRTPDETPPSSASEVSSGPPAARKLFIGLDDDGFHVPSADDRAQFFDSDPHEVYSRLNRNLTSKSRDSKDVTFFEQSDFYWEPPSSTTELYNQLSQRKYREIQRDYIHITECLGYGHFGTVHNGVWDVPGGKVSVAVKTLKPDSPEEARVMFLREAAIMGQFLHPNVVKLQGVVTVGEPLMIVLELMPRGDLKHYLRDFKYGSTPIPSNLPYIFINFCRQISSGMNYLSNKAFVHRDLATRNILLTEDLVCKIGDFGMARDVAENSVYHSQGGKIPIKWTAPEALNYRDFSTASDVWSYGMVLFEIWSLGRKPYERVSTNKMMELVNSGHCQSPPPGCPRAIYQLMIQCWHFVPSKRPKFSEICDYLNSSDDLLLNWSSTDKCVSERVMELGAPLTESRNLYPDLQCTYEPML